MNKKTQSKKFSKIQRIGSQKEKNDNKLRD